MTKSRSHLSAKTFNRCDTSLALPAEKRVERAVALILALAAMAPVAYAQTAQSNGQSNLNSPVALNEVVVTAQKYKQRIQDVPISITEISASALAKANVTTASDLPSLVSGLVWGRQGGWFTPSLRGISTSVVAVGASSPVAIYVDGVYQAMPLGTLADLPDIKSIEVLKGPQGTLFGRNATGGAISINTLDPSFVPTGNVEVGYGEIGGGSAKESPHETASAFVSGPLVGHTLAGSLSAYYGHTNGYLTNDLNGSRNGRVDSQVLRGKLLWQPVDNVKVLASAFYTHRLDGAVDAPFPYDGETAAQFYPGSIIPTQPWHIAYNFQSPDVETDARGGSIKTTVDLGLGTLTSITAYSNTEVKVFTNGDSAWADPNATPNCITAFVCVVANPIFSYDQTSSQEFDFASNKIGRFRFVGGLYGFYNRAREHDSYNNAAFIDDTVIRDESYAAFGEATYDVTRKLSTILGVRLTREELKASGSFFGAALAPYGNKTWNSTTPRLSVVYKLTPTVNTYFTASEGFKAGVISGQYTPGVPPANPETVYAYELGIKAAEARYMLDLSTYYYDYRDLQVETLIDSGAVTVPQNAARARIFGVDFDGAIRWTDEFETRLDTTYLGHAYYSSFPDALAYVPPLTAAGKQTVTYNATGTRMLSAPVWTGTLSGTYTKTLTPGTFAATASVYFSSAYRWDYTGAIQTGNYSLINANLTFTPASSSFKYTLYGKNLANKAYVQGMTLAAVAPNAFFGQPREVGVKIDYVF